jgi:polyhydroxybutyrate depolymerase
VKRAAALGALVMLAACSSSTRKANVPTTTTATTSPPAACGNVRPAPTPRASFTFKGRAYRLAVPSDYDGTRAVPMLMVFHGFGSSKELIDADTGLDRLGSQRGYVVVTPDGSGTPRTWNLFDPNGPDDYGAVDALVVELASKLCIDSRRLYATGHSAGSAFAGFLVCKKPYRYAGVAMVSATVPSACPTNMKQSVLGIHGTADPAVLYDGGKGAGQSVAIPPIKETIANYAQRDECRANPAKDQPAPGVERLEYQGCLNGKHVALLTIVGGGHPWPGGLQATHERNAVPGARFEASVAILDFFDRVANT